MRQPILLTRQAMLVLAIFLATGFVAVAVAQTWADFAHQSSPHRTGYGYDAIVSIPDLLTDPNEVITLPVAVILIDFLDNPHHDPNEHTPEFYHDYTFGDGYGEYSSIWPSLRMIIWEASNGRFYIVPAEETHGVANDGIIGWVRAQCPPEFDANDPNDWVYPDDPNCDTWEYYREWDGQKKRAEAIRRADPNLDFSQYDTMDGRWAPGADDYITDNELAVMIIHARPNCNDSHRHADWGTEDCNVGAVRPVDPGDPDPTKPLTDPNAWVLDGKAILLHPSAVPEAAAAGVFAHEFAHQVFGLADLYVYNPAANNPWVKVQDGDSYYFCKPGEVVLPCNDDCASAICIEDRLVGSRSMASGSTEHSTVSGVVTACGAYTDWYDVWYAYTPAYSDTVTFSLYSGDMNTTLAIYTDCGTQITCNNDQPSVIVDSLSAGVTYLIRVAGPNQQTGSYTLAVEGGGGLCSHTSFDRPWEPQLAGSLSVMKDHSTHSPHLSPWSNMHLGFTKPLIVTEDGTYTLHRAETIRSIAEQANQPEALIIHDASRADPYSEYFMLENRAPRDWNEYLGSPLIGEGLAIWHIDEDAFTSSYRRGIRLMRPQLWASDARALWDARYADTCYDLTTWSSPMNTRWANGDSSDIDILTISAAGETMTVDIRLPGVFVNVLNTGVETGTRTQPWNTVEEGAIHAAYSGRKQTVRIAPGTYTEHGLQLNGPCTLDNWGTESVYIGP